MRGQGLKERALSALQRDRLSGVLKESLEKRTGCFYFSMLMAWEQLNPKEKLSREIDKKLLSLDTLRVRPNEVIHAVKIQEGLLHIGVSKIFVTNFITIPLESIRQSYNIPPEIPLVKVQGDKLELDDSTSAIIYWLDESDLTAHYTSLFASSRFQGEEVLHGNSGDGEYANLLFNIGYRPLYVYQISKK